MDIIEQIRPSGYPEGRIFYVCSQFPLIRGLLSALFRRTLADGAEKVPLLLALPCDDGKAKTIPVRLAPREQGDGDLPGRAAEALLSRGVDFSGVTLAITAPAGDRTGKG